MNLPETMKIKPYQTLLCQFFLNKVLMCLKHFFMNFIFYTFFTTFIPACSALTPPFLSPLFDPCPLPYQFVMRNMDMGNKCSSDCFVVMEFNQKIHFSSKVLGFICSICLVCFILRYISVYATGQDKCGYDIVYLQV